MSNLPSLPWWPTPAPQMDPLDALKTVAAALCAGAQGEAGVIVGKALERYLQGENDLGRALGLKRRRGEQWRGLQDRQTRDAWLRQLVDLVPGASSKQKCVGALDFLENRAAAATPDSAALVAQLQCHYPDDLPRSWEHLHRLTRRR